MALSVAGDAEAIQHPQREVIFRGIAVYRGPDFQRAVGELQAQLAIERPSNKDADHLDLHRLEASALAPEIALAWAER